MKKGLLILMSVLCLVFAFSGCNLQGGDVKSHKAFTFFVDSGDHVQVELDTTGGYDITSEMPFVISKDGSTQSQGMFIKAEYFESYKEVVNTDANAKVIETKTKDSNEYVFQSHKDSEFNIVMLVDDSSTAVLIGNAVSEESARECFERLTISLDD